MQIVFTLLAERQLDRLYDYITTHGSEKRADGYITRIVSFCQGLKVFPHRGTQRDDILPGLRTAIFESRVVIAFVIATDMLIIEGVFYGGQDFDAVLRNQE